MAAPLLALTLGIAAEVWAGTEGFAVAPGPESSSCSSEAFAAAVRAQRPTADVHAWLLDDPASRPPATALRAKLTQRGADVILEIVGAGSSVIRTLPAVDGCDRNVATAALIVDGALDELNLVKAAPRVDSLAPPVPWWKQIHLSVAAGAGVEQGFFGVVPAFDVGATLRYRFVELTLDADLGLPSTEGFAVGGGVEAQGTGALAASAYDVAMGVGVAPHLGPGRPFLDLVFGVGVLSVTPTSPASAKPTVFQEEAATWALPFGALRAGYALDLPHGIFVMVRGEERRERTASLQIEGQVPASGPITSPRFVSQALGLAGFHFF